MRSEPTLTISIVSFNTCHLLRSLLTAITRQGQNAPLVVVIDNASTDGSAEMVAQHFPHVRLIRNETNRGFGAAHNQCLQELSTTYWLILNPDAMLAATHIQEMVRFMDQRPRCGIAGCLLSGFDGEFQPSAGNFPFGLALTGWLFNLETVGIQSNLHRSDIGFYEKSGRVDWVSGACMLIRSDLARKLGGFDERYFLYFEDIDLCFRARKAGYLTFINQRVTVRHLGGASTPSSQFYPWFGSLLGGILFYRHHRGKWAARIVQGLAILGVAARVVAYRLLGRRASMETYVRVLRALRRTDDALLKMTGTDERMTRYQNSVHEPG